MKRDTILKIGITVILMAATTGFTNQSLPAGVWTNITPPGSLAATGVYHSNFAPSNPSIIYVSSDHEGMYKTTNGGESWIRLGNPNGSNTLDSNEYLDDPCMIFVNPIDPNHVVACEGVDGGRQGFWVSRNGGQSWTIPQGFRNVGAQVGGRWGDVVMMYVNPADFNHILVSTHSDWDITSGYSSGIYETRDGGATFTYHLPPNDQWAAGTKGIHMLYHPATNTGNSNTWLVCDEVSGFWRTTNAGESWTKVSNFNSPHGGNQSYYASDGTIYIGTNDCVAYSIDNGVTWSRITSVPPAVYMTVCGTGSTLYTQGNNFSCNSAISFYTSPETDGRVWTAQTGGPSSKSWEMRFDPVNSILYTANTCGGFWALRVPSQNSGITLTNPVATPNTIMDNEKVTVTLSINATAQATLTGVTIDLRTIGGQNNVVMTNTSGNTYSTTFTIESGAAVGTLSFPVTANDNQGHSQFSAIRFTVHNHAEPILVSSNKPVSVSSIQDTTVGGSKAVDGSLGTRWSSNTTDSQWIAIDLQSVMTVNQVILKWEAAYAKSYKIQVSSNGMSWTDVYSTTTENGGTDLVTFAQTSARYVRMYGIERGTQWGYSLYEFEVYSPSPGEITALDFKQAKQSKKQILTFSENRIELNTSSTSHWKLELYTLAGARIATYNRIGNSTIIIDENVGVNKCVIAKFNDELGTVVQKIMR